MSEATVGRPQLLDHVVLVLSGSAFVVGLAQRVQLRTLCSGCPSSPVALTKMTAGSAVEGRACGRVIHHQSARARDRLEVVVAVEAVCILIEGVDGDQPSAGVGRGADDAFECVEEQLGAQSLPVEGSGAPAVRRGSRGPRCTRRRRSGTAAPRARTASARSSSTRRPPNPRGWSTRWCGRCRRPAREAPRGAAIGQAPRARSPDAPDRGGRRASLRSRRSRAPKAARAASCPFHPRCRVTLVERCDQRIELRSRHERLISPAKHAIGFPGGRSQHKGRDRELARLGRERDPLFTDRIGPHLNSLAPSCHDTTARHLYGVRRGVSRVSPTPRPLSHSRQSGVIFAPRTARFRGSVHKGQHARTLPRKRASEARRAWPRTLLDGVPARRGSRIADSMLRTDTDERLRRTHNHLPRDIVPLVTRGEIPGKTSPGDPLARARTP